MLTRNRLYIFGALLTPVALFVISLSAMEMVEKDGWRFFNTGKEIVQTLGRLGKALEAKNLEAVENFYAAKFKGQRLGLNNLELVTEKDGIRKLRLKSDGSADTPSAAVEEWRAYVNSFESVSEVGVHIHRLEKWKDDLIVSARFEMIGIPKGLPRSVIDRAYFRIKFERESGGLKIVSASLIEGERSSGEKPHFADISAAAGIDFKNEYYPEFLKQKQKLKFAMIRYGPAGITTADYDNDGYHDLFIPDGVESKLFRNRGDGKFEDVTAKAGLAGLDGVSVGLFADFDNDGFKDFFVSRTFKPNQLFRNNGNGTFTDVTKKSRIEEDCCTTVASWADYDNDGFLDLYVGRYLDPRTKIPTTFYARNGEPNQLYHNNGDGTFTNVTEKSGVGELGLCLGTVFGDYDDDGYPDLYVVNDFGRKTLYHNNGNGTFTDVTVKSGTLAYGAGMSASMGDYDNDGKLDIYCTNIRSEDAWYAEWPTVMRYMANCWKQGVWKTDMPLYFEVFKQSGFGFVEAFQQMASGNTLLRNKGDGTFEDTTWKAGANPLGWFWGSSFADFDNDGWQDIYAADGWVYNSKGTEIEMEFLNNVVSKQDEYKTGIFFDPEYFGEMSWHGWEHNRHLRNNGDGTFDEVGTAAGTDLIRNTRGVAVADFWNRGVLDMALSASTEKHVMLRNEVGGKRNWLGVELEGTKSNRDAVGARVTITVRGKLQMREVVLGDGYGSQNTLRQHFGLSDSTAVDELTVKWPRSASVQKFKNVAGNRIIRITEGKDELVERHYKGRAK